MRGLNWCGLLSGLAVCVLLEGVVALFEVSREGLVIVLCGAGPIGPCLCGGC